MPRDGQRAETGEDGERSADAVKGCLDRIRLDAREGRNVMPALVEAALGRCTLGEMVQAMADVYGRYAGGPEW